MAGQQAASAGPQLHLARVGQPWLLTTTHWPPRVPLSVRRKGVLNCGAAGARGQEGGLLRCQGDPRHAGCSSVCWRILNRTACQEAPTGRSITPFWLPR